MKKIIAVFLLLTVAASLTACNSVGKMNDEEYSEYVAQEQSKNEQKSIQAEEDFSNGVSETVEDIGKTVKDKKLVLMRDNEVETEYRVIYMKTGKGDYMVTYTFAKDVPYYITIRENLRKSKELYKHDDDSRMVAVKNGEVDNAEFQKYYDNYKKDTYWKVVE